MCKVINELDFHKFFVYGSGACQHSGDNRIHNLRTILFFRCHAAIISVAVITGLISLCTIALNIIVLIIFRAMQNLHSQSIYKLSLAVSDLLTGVLLIPYIKTFVDTFHISKVDRYKMWVKGEVRHELRSMHKKHTGSNIS